MSVKSIAITATIAAILAACGRLGMPLSARMLDAPTQRAAAGKLVRTFADVCLSASDARAATQALRSKGWPFFNVVWNRPDSVFYAAKPSPAGLFVIGDRRADSSSLTCIGHYFADTPSPMIAAMERRWGPSGEGPAIYPTSRAWTFRMMNGALVPLPSSAGGGGPLTAAALRSLRANEALVYAQVYYNRPYHDVASLLSVRRGDVAGRRY